MTLRKYIYVLMILDIVQQATFFFSGTTGAAVALHKEIILQLKLVQFFLRGHILHIIFHDFGAHPLFDGIFYAVGVDHG